MYFQWVYQCAHFKNPCAAGVVQCLHSRFAWSDIVDMYQSWVDDLYDGLCTICHNPACYGFLTPKCLDVDWENSQECSFHFYNRDAGYLKRQVDTY